MLLQPSPSHTHTHTLSRSNLLHPSAPTNGFNYSSSATFIGSWRAPLPTRSLSRSLPPSPPLSFHPFTLLSLAPLISETVACAQPSNLSRCLSGCSVDALCARPAFLSSFLCAARCTALLSVPLLCSSPPSHLHPSSFFLSLSSVPHLHPFRAPRSCSTPLDKILYGLF